MDKALIIKRQLKIIGNTVYLHDGEWSSMPFRAVVQHLWRKKSSNFESTLTELGSVNAEYYLYIGPSNYNIKTLSETATLTLGSEVYEFRCKDAVSEGDSVLYYTGILRKVGDSDENSD